MRVVIQRCTKGSVVINNEKEESINKGYVILLGITNGDSVSDIEYLVNKIINLRIFEDEQGKMNLSIKDVKGEILLISQFTLYADTSKGNRPSFQNSLKFDEAKELYDSFINYLSNTDISFKTGEFGADMDVSLINNGPVTIILDSKEKCSII